jgi:hypothetical protein
MNTIKTKFRAGQTVWLASIPNGTVRKGRIYCVYVRDYGDKTNVEYSVSGNWYAEGVNESYGLFATKREADGFVLQGAPSFNEARKQKALDRVKFQEAQLEKAKADLEILLTSTKS